MSDLVKQDTIKNLFGFPRWFDELDVFASTQRGLRVRETGKDIVVEAVVAGVPSKDVEVNIEDGVLVIKAEAFNENESEGNFQSQSYNYYYTTALRGGQWDKADAEIENGVLKIIIPKTEAARPRKLTIKTK